MDISGSQIGLMFDDGNSELVLRLKSATGFEYEDMRNLPLEAASYPCGIAICFGLVPDSGEPDLVGITELRDGVVEAGS
jgi:hypothetical protein